MKWCNNAPKYVQVSDSLRLQCPLSLRTDEMGLQILCYFPSLNLWGKGTMRVGE